MLLSCTEKQSETVDLLLSKLDSLQYENDSDIAGDIFFCGESSDGPCAGSILRDGNIVMLVGSVSSDLDS